MKKNIVRRLFATFVIILFALPILAQEGFGKFTSALQWRCIGPHRGGRTVGAVGIPSQPNVFFIGVNNGGVWKTTDFGRTWMPIFDSQPTGSIGDIAISPSNPDIIYVGSGEGLQRPDLSVGNGIYKTTDGGRSWINTGLQNAQQIGGMAIDPSNPDRVFVAALGHPYGPNSERGVYRTLNGGKTWEKILYKDENTGAIQVAIDPSDPNIIYADLWAGRQGPWENGAWDGAGSGLYKSTDGGNSWVQLTKGLPTPEQELGRIGICIAPSDPKRLYATVDAGKNGGIYRSDDAGASWYRIQNDNRLWGRGDDFAEVQVDPTNADIVYSANVVTWKSVDGGKTWNAFRGAPGGDDYHRIWINPKNPKIILIASDQGAIITVNGGETFSSWYNQPTAQFYHVITDNAFPYNVYGGQQESGSVGIASRGNDGSITFREWHPVGVEEYGYVAPDPLNPDIIYGGKISKYDKKTGQVQNIAPEAVRSGKYRFLRTAPVIFSPIDPKKLFFAGNVLFETTTGGKSWKVISPDLTRESWDIPASVGIYTTAEMKNMPRRGVIYAVSPSHTDINTIWAGTDDGLVHVTRDGGHTWKNVTPASVTSWSKVSQIDAGHWDANTAYIAVNRIRCDDLRPHIYKTHDGGKSWEEIVTGLPTEPINTVREDPKRKGLLYAGSETAVYFSTDDGAHWESLRLNMPATSIRDLVVKDDDIVVGTHGRSFWILDNISLLRQLKNVSDNKENFLFKPQDAVRVRWNLNTDTPLPPEEPAGQNPPDGAIIDYYLGSSAAEVTLEITRAGRNGSTLIRKYSSRDTMYAIPPNNVPPYWLRPQEILGKNAGAHRFVWDLHYTPRNIPATFPIAAIYKNTDRDPTSPWVMPGTYVVTLNVDGRKYVSSLTVKMDPRVKTSVADLQLQHDLSLEAYNSLQKIRAMSATGENAEKLSRLSRAFESILNILQDTDMPPTDQLKEAMQKAMKDFDTLHL